MRPKKSASDHRVLIEKLFDQLLEARHKIPPRRLRINPNAYLWHPHLAGAYNCMTDEPTRHLERGGKKAVTKREEDSEGSGSETDQSETEKGPKKRPKKEQKKPHRKRPWVLLWEGESADTTTHLAKAVNMTVDAIEALLRKDIKPTIMNCAKSKSHGCPFKCKITTTETGTTLSGLGAHKHKGKPGAKPKEGPTPEREKKKSAPSARGPVDAADGSPRRLKQARTDDADAPLSSPALLPLPAGRVAAWKAPSPSSEEEEGDEEEDISPVTAPVASSSSAAASTPSAITTPPVVAMTIKTREGGGEGEEEEEEGDEEEDDHHGQEEEEEEEEYDEEARRIRAATRAPLAVPHEEMMIEPARGDDHMFASFEPGFLGDNPANSTYHAIGAIGGRPQTAGGMHGEEDGEDEGEDGGDEEEEEED